MTNNEICIGCGIHSVCDKPSRLYDQVCPCIICLIKIMFKSSCEEYDEYKTYLCIMGIL